MRRILTLVILLVSLPVAARERAVRHPARAQSPTFSNEVVRIFQQHCQNCHREGDIAPFPLVTYADAKPRAALIKFMIETKKMPPWKPAEGCGDFKDERRLTDAEISTISKWVAAGAPEGNRADLPPAREFPTDWILGQPDLVLANAEPYTPPAGTDTYRCFTIPTNTTAMKYVKAIDTRPGDRETVHHVLSFIDTTGASAALDEQDPGPGYTCFGGPGFNLTGTLGGWAPGSRPLELPAGTGFELPANARVVLQVHYHPHHGDPEPDQTQVAVYFADEKPAKIMRIVPIANTTFTIPPNDPNYRVEAELPIRVPFPLKLWFIAPHMHLLGRKMRVEMTPLNSDQSQCLIDIPDWDFNWQGSYAYENPVDIPAGARLSLTAYYDNSVNNPRNPNNPPKPVSWGEATTDEMCLAFLGVTIE
jgi:hypothetical protein